MLTFFGDDYESKMTQKRPWYDNTFTLEILKDSGINCPSVIELLGKLSLFKFKKVHIIHFCVKIILIRRQVWFPKTSIISFICKKLI
jgi:hypothetical protein